MGDDDLTGVCILRLFSIFYGPYRVTKIFIHVGVAIRFCQASRPMGIVGLTKEEAVFASEGRVFLTSSQGNWR